MKTNKGFTLIEIAVVLAIIAILAAILTPIVTSYIDQARVTRAASDVKKIAEAALLLKRDTGAFPGYENATNAKAGGTPFYDCLVSGTSTTLTTAFKGTYVCTQTNLLTNYLNINSLGFATSQTESAAAGGAPNFRGPYLDNLAGYDPWGSPYIVNSGNLGNSSSSWAFALSAGPDGAIASTQNQPKTAAMAFVGDDLGAQIK